MVYVYVYTCCLENWPDGVGLVCLLNMVCLLTPYQIYCFVPWLQRLPCRFISSSNMLARLSGSGGGASQAGDVTLGCVSCCAGYRSALLDGRPSWVTLGGVASVSVLGYHDTLGGAWSGMVKPLVQRQLSRGAGVVVLDCMLVVRCLVGAVLVAPDVVDQHHS
jgi:hypothetical protein